MCLHTYTVDGNSLCQHILKHCASPFKLGGVYQVVVVVDEFASFRSVLLGGPESPLYELGASESLVPGRAGTVDGFARLVGKCLVNYIPGIDEILGIVVEHCLDVILVLCHHLLFGERLALGIVHIAPGGGTVPNQSMAAHLNSILLSESDDLVGLSEIIGAVRADYVGRFHHVLCSHRVEMLLYHFSFLAYKGRRHYSNTDLEVILYEIFQSRNLVFLTTAGTQYGGSQC